MIQTGQQIITIHILPNISRSKGNQTFKFGQLISELLPSLFLLCVQDKVYQNILKLRCRLAFTLHKAILKIEEDWN